MRRPHGRQGPTSEEIKAATVGAAIGLAVALTVRAIFGFARGSF